MANRASLILVRDNIMHPASSIASLLTSFKLDKASQATLGLFFHIAIVSFTISSCFSFGFCSSMCVALSGSNPFIDSSFYRYMRRKQLACSKLYIGLELRVLLCSTSNPRVLPYLLCHQYNSDDVLTDPQIGVKSLHTLY